MSCPESVCVRLGGRAGGASGGVCVCVGGRWTRRTQGGGGGELGQRGEETRGGRGSSAELAEGPAARSFVMRLGVRLPALPLRRLVVNVRRRPREVVGILLHHLQLGLDGSDLGARAGVGREEEEEEEDNIGDVLK